MASTNLTAEYTTMTGIHIASAMVCLVLVLIMCVILIINLKRYYKCKMYNEFLKQQLFVEKNICKRVDEIYEQSRIMRHDIKHYLTTLLGLIVNEDYKEAEKLIIDIIGKASESSMINYASSSIVNAVLNSKNDECKRKNIHFDIKVSGGIPKEKQINIAIVLSNLLDNAIEGTVRTKDKKIKLEMYEQKGMFYILVENTFNKALSAFDGKLESEKSNRKRHGLGTISIKKLVKDVDGIYTSSIEDNIFMCQISIPFVVKLLDKINE